MNKTIDYKYVKNYIATNLSEFSMSYSPQANYPNNANLDGYILNSGEDVNSFLKFLGELEDELVNKLYGRLSDYCYSFDYAGELYYSAINAVSYCFCKLVPNNKVNSSNDIIAKLSEQVKNNNRCMPLLYLSLNSLLTSYSHTFNIELLRILKDELGGIELSNNLKSVLYGFEYLHLSYRHNRYNGNYDESLKDFIGNFQGDNLIEFTLGATLSFNPARYDSDYMKTIQNIFKELYGFKLLEVTRSNTIKDNNILFEEINANMISELKIGEVFRVKTNGDIGMVKIIDIYIDGQYFLTNPLVNCYPPLINHLNTSLINYAKNSLYKKHKDTVVGILGFSDDVLDEEKVKFL